MQSPSPSTVKLRSCVKSVHKFKNFHKKNESTIVPAMAVAVSWDNDSMVHTACVECLSGHLVH